MADLKISQLTDGNAAQAADEFVVARSGGNFRIDGASVAAAATSVGTLSSLTVSGNLTVDTNTLFVNSSTNRVGIGTTSPDGALDVAGDAYVRGPNKLYLDNIQNYTGGSTPIVIQTGGAQALQLGTNGTTRVNIDSSGNLAVDTNTLYVDAVNNRVGIGTATPGALLDLNAPSGSNTNIAISQNNSVKWFIGNVDTANAFRFYDNTAAAERMRIDASGNLGLGVTPSAWDADFRAIQIGSARSGFANDDWNGFTEILNNVYGSARDTFTRIQSLGAGRYSMQLGSHKWYVGGSASAGVALTSTPSMTLDASGRLGIATTSPNYRLSLGAGTGAKMAVFDGSGIAQGLGTDMTSGSPGYELSIFSGYSGGNGIITFGGYDTATSTFTQRAQITSGGDFCVNTTGLDGQFRVRAPNEIKWARATSHPNGGTQYFDSFRYDTTEIGTITGNNTATAYNTSSDVRLKENIAPAEEAGAVIDAIEVVQHDWKVGGHVRYGFVAQALNETFPEAVTAGDDGDEDSEIVRTWGVDYSKLVPMLVKEIQSLRARVAVLEG